MESLLFVNRLNNVDFPTFGLPTITTKGIGIFIPKLKV
jgi:hypothetical protein